MRKIAFILLALCLSTGITIAQKKKANPIFNKTVHDFGKVKESAGSVKTIFTFVNKGDAPFIINRVQTTCGCTTPTYSKEPILPGKQGSIEVSYSTTGRPGAIKRQISIYSNVADTVYTLNIRGEVVN